MGRAFFKLKFEWCENSCLSEVHVWMEPVFVQRNILVAFVDWVSICFSSSVLDIEFRYCVLDNPCYNPICRNGGVCSTNSNSSSVSFICTCPGLYTGQFCEASIFNQLQSAAICPSACLNGGTCINGACTCTSQYIGLICQYRKRNKIK